MSTPSKAVLRGSLPEVEPMRLRIAEDNAMGCEMLKRSLKRSQLGASRFASATTYAQILDVIAKNQIDVALIGEQLEDGSRHGIEIIEHLRKTRPAIRSILLARFLTPELVLAAFRNGAKGIFCRSESIQSLARCVRAVHQGQVWVNSKQLEIILQALVQARPTRLMSARGTSVLTKREAEVANLVAEGLTNREVANRLGLTEHTVGNYLFKCYEKLGLSTRVEFVLCILNQRNKATDSLPIN
jgi:two-component system nitrate/nitrite response regulator NarL